MKLPIHILLVNCKSATHILVDFFAVMNRRVIGTLRNYDGDGRQNFKKEIGLIIVN